MEQLLTGTIQGNTIVLDAPPDVPEGEHVEVIVRTSAAKRKPGDGILRSAGALEFEFTEEDQRILDEIQQARHISTRPVIEP
jgi:hypothetical protein